MKTKASSKSNLSEAVDQLNEIIEEIDGPEYSETELMIQLEHAYHHMNFAWHIRSESEKDVIDCAGEKFRKWSKYPAGELNEYE